MKKNFTFYPQGTCSQRIDIALDGDTIEQVVFTGGCNGNLKGISSLIKGMKAEDVINRLQGIQCGNKGTSCPDQLSKALKQMTSGATN